MLEVHEVNLPHQNFPYTSSTITDLWNAERQDDDLYQAASKRWFMIKLLIGFIIGGIVGAGIVVGLKFL